VAFNSKFSPIRVPFKVQPRETTAPASLSHLRLADTGYDLWPGSKPRVNGKNRQPNTCVMWQAQENFLYVCVYEKQG
jgi:hypothetical protein